MRGMQASIVKMLQSIVTALMPGVFALFLFNQLVDGLGGQRMGRAFLAHGNGFEPFPRRNIEPDGHGYGGGGHGYGALCIL